ncbi:LytR C-terminal domain-containing protein [Pseudoclavibacter sp. 13-3]|uniref:LytR C-terminal domain-containing protein n=1 Tax=Pseudoclavibacter sp. 13-3 TaxID=2901228 RepID=UPI001E61A84B|nr:LytR C-terminal domain-containing protein [Pseudoclavibacter sp. 13-3]MCD7101774.1 LytR C-terminal domain-containing protein [Pseudoclavibacter sp. 13-3]
MAEKFPKDEFDDLSASRKVGAHRAAERGWRTLRIVIGALIATALVVGIVYGVMQITRSQSVFHDYSAAPQSESSDPAESASPSSEAVESAEGASAEPSDSASPSPSPSAAAVNAHSLEVTVLNAQGANAEAGLAARTGAKLTAKGWKIGQVATASSSFGAHRSTIVYYTDERYADAAKQLSSDLQITTAPQYNATLSVPLTVAIGSDYSARR